MSAKMLLSSFAMLCLATTVFAGCKQEFDKSCCDDDIVKKLFCELFETKICKCLKYCIRKCKAVICTMGGPTFDPIVETTLGCQKEAKEKKWGKNETEQCLLQIAIPMMTTNCYKVADTNNCFKADKDKCCEGFEPLVQDCFQKTVMKKIDNGELDMDDFNNEDE